MSKHQEYFSAQDIFEAGKQAERENPCPPDTTDALRAEVERMRDTPHPNSEVEKDWQEFWLTWTFSEGYTLNDIKAELCDYHMFLQEVAKVYSAVTADRVSKPNTKAEAVIGEYQAVLSDLIDEAVGEATEDLRAEIERLTAENERVRAETIEEAAKVADKKMEWARGFFEPHKNNVYNVVAMTAAEVAQEIRALALPDPSEGKAG
jgi:hypothetical protein